MPIYYECSRCGRNDKRLTLGSFGLCNRMVNGKWLDLCDACLASYNATCQDAENIKITMLEEWLKRGKTKRRKRSRRRRDEIY